MMKNVIFILLLFTLACNKDDDDVTNPHEEHESELITTLELEFKKKGKSAVTETAVFKDPDGDGGNDPTRTDTIDLKKDTLYAVSISVRDESGSSTEDITAEIEAEGDEHIFCFKPESLKVDITKTDSDGKHPIGLKSEWKPTGSGKGTIMVTLKHQPGTKDGTCSPGETDIEVTFPLVVN